jgi:uncharacterized membrane protein YphA (DoxX/SURF4 family)
VGGFRLLYQGFADLLSAATADPVPLSARIALAAVFAAAGTYKVRHPLVAAQAMVNFRVLASARKHMGRLLGVGETLIALTLLAPVAAVAFVGCAAAGSLSVGYVVVTVNALRRGDRFPCRCLPGLGGDVSPATLTRACAMVVGSAIGLVGPVRGAAVEAEQLVPATALAVAAVGFPLACVAARTGWRSYRSLLAATDWSWVLTSTAPRTSPEEPR